MFARLAQQTLGDERGRRYLNVLGDAGARQDVRDALRDMFHCMVDALDLEAFSPMRIGCALLPARSISAFSSPCPHRPKSQPALRRRIDLPEVPAGEVRVMIGGTTVTLTAAERDVLAALLAADS